MPRKTPQFRSWDDYYIPGPTVLRNKLTSATEPYGTTDPDKLRPFEERAASVRLVAAKLVPIRGSFDYNHLKALHRALFQDVYDWAGEERTGPLSQMSKSGPDVVHYPPGDPQAPMVSYGYYLAPAIADAAKLMPPMFNFVDSPNTISCAAETAKNSSSASPNTGEKLTPSTASEKETPEPNSCSSPNSPATPATNWTSCSWPKMGHCERNSFTLASTINPPPEQTASKRR